MPCVAPSEFLDTQTAAQFGNRIAEKIIQSDYLTSVGRGTVFPVSPKDFIDFSLGFGNSALFIAFLKTNNPRLSVKELAILSASAAVKVPDIMTHDVPRRTEFYEIKPNSVDGRLAGTTKVALIDALMRAVVLPYRPGIQYAPNKRVMLYSGTPLGKKLQVFFHFESIAPGLIVYELCAEGDLMELGLAVLLAILTIIIIILLKRPLPGGSPAPVPAIA